MEREMKIGMEKGWREEGEGMEREMKIEMREMRGL